MTFVNPLLLWGLLAVLIPPVVWLLTRRKWRVMEWGAIDILMEIMQEQQKRRRLWEIILWTLRVLLLALVALALARPLLSSGALGGGGGRLLILIDDSFSMAARSGASDRFDRAKAEAIALVEQADPQTRIALLSMSAQSEPIIGHFSPDHPLLLETLKCLQVSAAAGNPDRGLAEAQSLIERSGGTCSTTIISDFQQADWAEASDERQDLLRRLQAQGGVSLVSVDDGQTSNCSAVDLRLNTAAARSGRPVPLSGRVLNHGSVAVTMTVELLIDEAVTDSARITVPAGGSAEAQLRTGPLPQGLHRVSLRLPHDAVPTDNSFALALEVVDAIPVLAVVPDSSDLSGPVPTSFIELCLNPELDAGDSTAFDIRTVGMAEFLGEDLSGYQLVILAQVPSLNVLQAEHLEHFVHDGGGAMLFFGADTEASSWNELLHRGGEGLLARPLSGELLRQADEQQALDFAIRSPGHPLWRGLADGDTDYFAPVAIWSGWSFADGADARSVPLLEARSADQDPYALIAYDSGFGDGHVLVFGTSADLSMNNLAIRKVYVGVISQAVAYLRTFAGGKRGYQVGETAVRRVDFERSQASYLLTAPDDERRVISVEQRERQFVLPLPPMRVPGFHNLVNTAHAGDADLLVANVDTSEGAIAGLDGNALAERYSASGAGIGAARTSGGGSELAAILLLLAALCWMGENIIANRIMTA